MTYSISIKGKMNSKKTFLERLIKILAIITIVLWASYVPLNLISYYFSHGHDILDYEISHAFNIRLLIFSIIFFLGVFTFILSLFHKYKKQTNKKL